MIQLKDLTLGYEQRTLLEKSPPTSREDNSSHCSAETAQEKVHCCVPSWDWKSPKRRDYPARE